MKQHKQRTIMCEIFGITSKNKIQADYMLNKFFSHSVEHQHGWGIAIFDGFSVSVEREPVRAIDSVYLKNRLTGDFLVDKMMAHIRRATSGLAEYNNTHPFVKADESGRKWTLVHNGHIFDATVLRMPENQLFIYHDGELLYEGERHENTYVSDPERERSLYLGFSGL